MRHPEYYNRADVKIYTWKFHRTIAQADRIIAISECTKRDIMHYGHVDPDRIEVIYQSCSTHFKLRESDAKLQDVHARYVLPSVTSSTWAPWSDARTYCWRSRRCST